MVAPHIMSALMVMMLDGHCAAGLDAGRCTASISHQLGCLLAAVVDET
jgi:hypothetical protein